MFIKQNYRFLDANADQSGNSIDPTQNSNPQVVAPQTSTTPSDAEINNAKMRKQLEKANEELETYKKAQSEAEKAKLAEEGKYQELLEKERAEKQELLTKVTKAEQQATLSRELQNAGLFGKNLELAMLQIASKVDMTATDAVATIQSNIAEFKTDYPALFTTPPPIPAGSTGVNATTSPQGSVMSKEEAIRIAKNQDITELLARENEVNQALSQ